MDMEPERGTFPGMEDKPHEAMPTATQGAALGETVQAGLDRAAALAKDTADKTRDTLAGYRDGGVEQLSEDIVEFVRSQPMTALLIATGVGVFLGMLLAHGRRAESG
jgi:ElaB/YqjD/DUF883 family membrane-anchored ribosome-binding protein